MFRRRVQPSERDPEVLVDSQLADAGYVDNVGFEWSQIDGFAGMEVTSHGSLFGRFLLPRNFFQGKTVVDVGCGNGRIGRLIAPLSGHYVGVDLSEAIFAFPKYTKRPRQFTLLRASGTDLPLADHVADATVCWGVLHHMHDPDAGLAELLRITRPGGTILVYVYPPYLDQRGNLSIFMRGLPPATAHAMIERMSDALDQWREVDSFYAEMVAGLVGLGFKHSREWQQFQWFDGVTPRYHLSIEQRITDRAKASARSVTRHWPGCLVIEV
jgi:SAM-dependent methyltransferase